MTEVTAMKTKLVKMDALKEAGEIIRAGGLVAFPTETVYGLGAVSYTHLTLLVRTP